MKYNQLRLVMTETSCNMRCSYCVAGYSTRQTQRPANDAVNQAKLDQILAGHEFSAISVWGGEPFYNISKLEKTVEYCNYRYPALPIYLNSNGTAFSRKTVSFVKRNQLRVILSHDAHNQHLRGLDYLNVPYYFAMINAIQPVAFNTVIHKYNCDFRALFQYFENIAVRLDNQINWNFELFQLASPQSLKYLPQGKSLLEFANSIDFLVEQFIKGHPLAYSAIYKILNGMAAVIDGDRTVKCRCGADNRFSITTDGDVAFCQVMAEKGNFNTPDMTLPDMCGECNVAGFCAGICPGLTDEYRKKMCIVYKIFYGKLYGFLLSLKPRNEQHDNINPFGGDPWTNVNTTAAS